MQKKTENTIWNSIFLFGLSTATLFGANLASPTSHGLSANASKRTTKIQPRKNSSKSRYNKTMNNLRRNRIKRTRAKNKTTQPLTSQSIKTKSTAQKNKSAKTTHPIFGLRNPYQNKKNQNHSSLNLNQSNKLSNPIANQIQLGSARGRKINSKKANKKVSKKNNSIKHSNKNINKATNHSTSNNIKPLFKTHTTPITNRAKNNTKAKQVNKKIRNQNNIKGKNKKKSNKPTNYNFSHWTSYKDLSKAKRKYLAEFNAQANKQPSSQPVKYASIGNKVIFYPQGSSSACEGDAFLMSINAKGHLRNFKAKYHGNSQKALRAFVSKYIGWYPHGSKLSYNTRASHKYTVDPFSKGHAGATIYASGLHQVANRMHIPSKNITGAGKNEIIGYLQKKDPIVVEASHHLRLPSDHIIALVGYQKDQDNHEFIQYADSVFKNSKSGIRWAPWSQFWSVYNRPNITGRRALVVLG